MVQSHHLPPVHRAHVTKERGETEGLLRGSQMLLGCGRVSKSSLLRMVRELFHGCKDNFATAALIVFVPFVRVIHTRTIPMFELAFMANGSKESIIILHWHALSRPCLTEK